MATVSVSAGSGKARQVNLKARVNMHALAPTVTVTHICSPPVATMTLYVPPQAVVIKPAKLRPSS